MKDSNSACTDLIRPLQEKGRGTRLLTGEIVGLVEKPKTS